MGEQPVQPPEKRLSNRFPVFSISHSHESIISVCSSLPMTYKDILIAKVAGEILDGLPKVEGIAEG